MLRGLDPLLTPDLLHALASMGHGDTIAVVDANFPAAATASGLFLLPGIDAPAVLDAILTLLPIDDFEPDPITVMQVVGDPDRHAGSGSRLHAVLSQHAVPSPVAIERHAFYRAAAACLRHRADRRAAFLRQYRTAQRCDPTTMIRVDAHHHVWRVARGDYHWLTPDLPIHRDYTLDDLRPLLDDITATVLVQAAPTEAETDFMLTVAHDSHALVRGVVGWTDLAAPNAAARVAAMSEAPELKGLRPMLQDIADTDWILRPAVQPALAAMTQYGLRFDALVQPRHLPMLLSLAERHPRLPIVIDHAAKPAIAHGEFEPWASDIARVARETNAFCKLSGLVTEACADWQHDDLRRYVDHLVACFGPSRLMWGSDWPVVELAGGYATLAYGELDLLADLDAASHDAILGGTACMFYGLGKAA